MKQHTAVAPDLRIRLIRPNDQPTSLMLDWMKAGYSAGSGLCCITGGCGNWEPAGIWSFLQSVSSKFTRFRGPVLFGGTRMELLPSREVLPGITELAPLIGHVAKDVLLTGITPFRGELRPHEIAREDGRIIVMDNQLTPAGESYRTIVHPSAYTCLLIQEAFDPPVAWNDALERQFWAMEWQLRLRLALTALTGGLRPFLLVSNGGQVTRDEVEAWLQNSLPVIFFGGTGRAADDYAAKWLGEVAGEESWRERHPTAFVVSDVDTELEPLLERLGVV